ncbi:MULTISPECIES: GPW/gp25 family protein [Burkholderia]|uniref:Type VI secretion protein n=1 Tax=Burkholderia savannae TaxID=1637837 RepID=A0ABR5T867_9BURK|nr:MULTISPECIES: GPW/gp25 family protein [Burkholderia]AOJ73221.1 type VI secretion protein [Burkholderia savannae]AOJ84977.1 type VI secretion protein [Burkholderia savannae]AOK51195.1 type VI secretion protein [Burkholderia sp. MSMB617WGS]KVG50135.1 type VI secretion protein [Burkholderia sp. MSMB0265]KVG80866.1 type VI secretion protein [Burkholderia sp. MSMB2040]
MSDLQLYNKLSRRIRRHSLQEVVADHLVDLMNYAIRGARMRIADDSPAAHSVLNFGCPPMQAAGATKINPAHAAAHICEVIRRFEPRVDSASTTVKPRTESHRRLPQTIYFDVSMKAREDGAELRASLALDYLSGYFSLADDR